MPFLFPLILFVFIVGVARLAARSSPGGIRTRFLTTGLEARGLVLSAANVGTQTTFNGQRFQVRAVVLDVEVPGRPPYEIAIAPMFPLLCDPFPGAALDLRVDPRNPKNVVVVGPAGSSGWLGAATGLFPWAKKTNAFASGCGTAVLVVITAFLALGAIVSFVNGSGSSSETPATPTAPTVSPPHVSVLPTAPHATSTAETPSSSHAACEAAARCCKTLDHVGCASFAKMSEAVCRGQLAQEKKTAASLQKTCE
jgi:hypothetical protein